MTTREQLLQSLLVERYQPIPRTPPAACIHGPTREFLNAQTVAEFFADDEQEEAS